MARSFPPRSIARAREGVNVWRATLCHLPHVPPTSQKNEVLARDEVKGERPENCIYILRRATPAKLGPAPRKRFSSMKSTAYRTCERRETSHSQPFATRPVPRGMREAHGWVARSGEVATPRYAMVYLLVRNRMGIPPPVGRNVAQGALHKRPVCGRRAYGRDSAR